jgi:hypothetical protein
MIYEKKQLPNLPPLQRGELTEFENLLIRYLNEQDQNLDAVLNNGLNPTDNFDGAFVTFTSSATPDAENSVSHTLKKIPTGFLVTGMDKGAVVYNGTTANDDQTIYLKVNVATVAVTIYVF